MTVKKIVFFLVCVFFTLSGSFSVEDLSKCSLKDYECQRNLYQTMVREIGKSGMPDLGIPKVDPIVLKNVSVSVLDLVNLTMVDGVAKGIKNCIVDSFMIDIEHKKGSQEITCDVIIKGQYSLSANSAFVKQVFGGENLHGEGKGKAQLEKLHISLTFPFYPEKHEDGEIYMTTSNKDIAYKYDVKGKASFAADNIFLGEQNISEMVLKYLNENARLLLRTSGKAFIDKAVELYFDFAQNFFSKVPAKHFVLEDLTPYL